MLASGATCIADEDLSSPTAELLLIRCLRRPSRLRNFGHSFISTPAEFERSGKRLDWPDFRAPRPKSEGARMRLGSMNRPRLHSPDLAERNATFAHSALRRRAGQQQLLRQGRS